MKLKKKVQSPSKDGTRQQQQNKQESETVQSCIGIECVRMAKNENLKIVQNFGYRLVFLFLLLFLDGWGGEHHTQIPPPRCFQPYAAFFGGWRNKGGFNARIYFLSAHLLMLFGVRKSVFMTFIRYGKSVARLLNERNITIFVRKIEENI